MTHLNASKTGLGVIELLRGGWVPYARAERHSKIAPAKGVSSFLADELVRCRCSTIAEEDARACTHVQYRHTDVLVVLDINKMTRLTWSTAFKKQVFPMFCMPHTPCSLELMVEFPTRPLWHCHKRCRVSCRECNARSYSTA